MGMDDIRIYDNASEEETDIVFKGILDYNLQFHPDYTTLSTVNLVLRDGEGRVYGGLLSRSYLLSLFVDILWIEESARRKGFGSKLLAEAEKHARDLGCNFIYLDTFSFQALDFYKKQGYTVFGVLDGYPDGIQRYYLKKDLK